MINLIIIVLLAMGIICIELLRYSIKRDVDKINKNSEILDLRVESLECYAMNHFKKTKAAKKPVRAKKSKV